ncbi:MAG: TIM barrel protein [Anaerolineae bacterium]|nr:TIM barrel protein [Anaerolineae bacterium]
MNPIWMLAISPEAGEAVVRRYGLWVEAYTRPDDPRTLTVADRVISGHAPGMLPGWDGWRVHIASTQPDLRGASLLALRAYIERAHGLFPNLRHINMHAAPHRFPDPPIRPGARPVPPLRPELARWDLLVEGARSVARLCGSLGLTLSVENNWAYWDGVAPETPPEACDPEGFVEYFCTAPEEWLRLAAEVDEANFAMCLDPSHAAPYCHRWPEGQRQEVLGRFLADRSRVGHVHWNDSCLGEVRGRDDLHLPVGEGDLGDGFHRAIREWAGQEGHIAVLEHFYDEGALERELGYVRGL